MKNYKNKKYNELLDLLDKIESDIIKVRNSNGLCIDLLYDKKSEVEIELKKIEAVRWN